MAETLLAGLRIGAVLAKPLHELIALMHLFNGNKFIRFVCLLNAAGPAHDTGDAKCAAEYTGLGAETDTRKFTLQVLLGRFGCVTGLLVRARGGRCIGVGFRHDAVR